MAKTKPTSLDGRSQKLSKPAWKPKDQPGASLKPASPPKDNPWHRRLASPVSDHEGPPKPLQLTTEEFPELSTPKAATGSGASAGEKAPSPQSCGVSKSSSTTSDTRSEETRSDLSRLSTPSRLILEEAADQAAKILWRHPFGSNVYLYVETSVFQLHRDILTRRSGWFRDKLPPPNKDGSPVEMHLPHAIGAIQPCLFFMYTKNLDICERDLQRPLDFIHVPRCVLAYCAAVNFRIPAMASRILAIMEETARHLATYLSVHYIYREMEAKTIRSMATYFVNAADILYSEPLFELMKPMRHALAGILDALLPSLLRQPYFPEVLNMPPWKRWSAAIAADQVEYRMALGHFRSSAESALPSELELEALFDRVLGQFGRGHDNTEDNAEESHGGHPGGGDNTDMSSGLRSKEDAAANELAEEEAALPCLSPSAGGSTGSEAGTWDSPGTDDVEEEPRGPGTASSFV
ncbi:hypothetical protein Trco_002122 [Trichoderma cornu-damae]|uniref:BTB domain-containing protein n=1 Tax=Trichoderma cornu-damae TaxID=654480 RepID=A0A9P8QP91_9HYPO|nr:hypothetical protein Trco_002122 [Trichoderma cornu-damae]